MSTCDVADDFLKALSAQSLGHKIREKCKEYLKFLDSLIKDDYERILKILDKEFIEFP